MIKPSTAVLLSGGLDSAVLLADEAARGGVRPVYVSVGLAWEAAEHAIVDRLLACEPLRGRTGPLATLSVDMADVYPSSHWALTGRPPAYHTPDEDVYLPGRNVVLLAKAAIFCAAERLDRIVLGTLAHNPFPDATPEFRASMAHALSLGLAHALTIEAPYAALPKAEVIRRGVSLGVPFEHTLSCMSPVGSGDRRSASGDRPPTAEGRTPSFRHCGTCSKCRERHDAFLEAGLMDPTDYADRAYMS